MSFWKEIRNDYICEDFYEEENCKLSVSIDVYKTNDSNENGDCIAKVLLTNSDDIVVVYLDYIARTDDYAQEKIKEAIKSLKEKASRENNSASLVKFIDENADGCGTDIVSTIKFNRPLSNEEVEKLKEFVAEYKKETEDWDTDSVIQYAVDKLGIHCCGVNPAFEIYF